MMLTILILSQSYSNDPIQHDRPSDRLAGWLSPEAIREIEPTLMAEYKRRNRLPRPVNTAGFMMFGLAPAQGRTPWLIEQATTSTQRLQTTIGIRNRDQMQWNLLVTPFGTTAELPDVLDLSGFQFSAPSQRNLRQDASDAVLGGAINMAFEPSLAWNQNRQNELQTTAEVARFGGPIWRTIVGDAALATGQDAKTTAESLLAPVDPISATTNFESRVEAINSAAQAPVVVADLALDLEQDQSQCNRWLSTLENQLKNRRWIDAGLTADKILRLSPDHPEAMLGEVLAHLGAGLWSTATSSFDRMLQSLPVLLGVRPEPTLRPRDERLREGIQQLQGFEREDASRLAVWLHTLMNEVAKRDEIRQTLDAEDPVNKLLDAGLGLHNSHP
ncbi:MAG: hypothetical protein VYC41_03845 [Planctomycetota bacterium]|nr:hypothetical protein [Planctomycetota bacterium]MEC8251241.1 hypothetical protein [Planctomycetota bacterium]MEC8354766.1 hypothetical protein [Planctomycetota bacterium]MEC8412838.1 hypothetical protein [Planctomycetota bacterium]MEC8854631.1 hypothetical protein [Planctomycetota bacterium]